MPTWTALGHYGQGYGLVVDFHKERAMVRCNTALVQGTELELIPPGTNGYAPGMVLIKRTWSDLYFLSERQGWEEEDYFKYAEKRIKELKLPKP